MTSTGTVASGVFDCTRAYFSQPPLLHLNSVAGELMGLVPVFRRTHTLPWPAIIRPIGVSSLTACALGGKVNGTPRPSKTTFSMNLAFCLSLGSSLGTWQLVDE